LADGFQEPEEVAADFTNAQQPKRCAN